MELKMVNNNAVWNAKYVRPDQTCHHEWMDNVDKFLWASDLRQNESGPVWESKFPADGHDMKAFLNFNVLFFPSGVSVSVQYSKFWKTIEFVGPEGFSEEQKGSLTVQAKQGTREQLSLNKKRKTILDHSDNR